MPRDQRLPPAAALMRVAYRRLVGDANPYAISSTAAESVSRLRWKNNGIQWAFEAIILFGGGETSLKKRKAKSEKRKAKSEKRKAKK
jgi:hypothetical protein